jgi:hypothetical protein
VAVVVASTASLGDRRENLSFKKALSEGEERVSSSRKESSAGS